MPVVDFDGDGMVAIGDLVRLIEAWGRDDPCVDIGPNPWGDGVVDGGDLRVLMSYWGQEIYSPSLLAYWKMDEEEGAIATDSAGANDATVVGEALWQSGEGKIKGALQLDGTDDSILTPYILNPAKGPFSVFAWVKGGAPGQVILSQVAGANWLRAAPTSGALGTELNEPGRNAAKNLQSPVVITDGVWHRVGLVWNCASRVLYVDDVEVARGTLTGLPDSINGLHIGAGSMLAAGTFWSGLIDDVRIYDRAIDP